MLRKKDEGNKGFENKIGCWNFIRKYFLNVYIAQKVWWRKQIFGKKLDELQMNHNSFVNFSKYDI